MLQKIMTRIFGSKKAQDWKELAPVVDEINAKTEEYKKLTDEDFTGITEQFKQRIQDGETVDDLLVSAFALVKEACRRLKGKTWQAGLRS